MEYRPIGLSGVSVSQLCLGGMMFGSLGNTDHDACVAIIDRALDAGVNFINTAGGYSNGESEEIFGAALAGGKRDEVVISTKFGPKLDGDPNHGGGARRWIHRAVEGSLRRLRTDWIDFFELGVPDPLTDLDETLGAFTDLVAAGKIRAFGTSKQPPSRLVEARALAERRGFGIPRIEESPYSMLTRAIEYDLVPTCQRLGVGVIAYSPLAGGWLSGKYRTGAAVAEPASRLRARDGRMDPNNPANAAKLAAVDALGALADESGLTLVQLATAFVLRHPGVASAVIGPRTMEHLEGYLAADDVELSTETLDRIDEIVPPGFTVDIKTNMWDVGTDALTPSRLRR